MMLSPFPVERRRPSTAAPTPLEALNQSTPNHGTPHAARKTPIAARYSPHAAPGSNFSRARLTQCIARTPAVAPAASSATFCIETEDGRKTN
jgi:hypothetical protein